MIGIGNIRFSPSIRHNFFPQNYVIPTATNREMSCHLINTVNFR